MKQKLAIVTGNSLKFRELSASLSPYFDCEQKILEGYIEIQGTPDDIMQHKLLAAYKTFKQPVLVDDTSVELDALNGFPGAYMKDFSKAFTIEGIGKQFQGSGMKVIALIGIMRSEIDYMIGKGEIIGTVVKATRPCEKDDLDFDIIFYVPEAGKTYADMTVDEKNSLSHRGLAIKDLLMKLFKNI